MVSWKLPPVTLYRGDIERIWRLFDSTVAPPQVVIDDDTINHLEDLDRRDVASIHSTVVIRGSLDYYSDAAPFSGILVIKLTSDESILEFHLRDDGVPKDFRLELLLMILSARERYRFLWQIRRKGWIFYHILGFPICTIIPIVVFPSVRVHLIRNIGIFFAIDLAIFMSHIILDLISAPPIVFWLYGYQRRPRFQRFLDNIGPMVLSAVVSILVAIIIHLFHLS